jgi:hypothetical protein
MAGTPRGAHIEGDPLQRLIVSGGVPPPRASPESERQIDLNLPNQCSLARSFLAEGFAAMAIRKDVLVARNAGRTTRTRARRTQASVQPCAKSDDGAGARGV